MERVVSFVTLDSLFIPIVKASQKETILNENTEGEIEMSENTDLKQFDISIEEYREYDFGGRVYRIHHPVTLYYRVGGTTHRVVDNLGVAHCVPSPGVNGCVLRWKSDPPVSF